MERLKIRNFLNIKEADFDVKRLNFIIGPQSCGKSIIAKLIYFFRMCYCLESYIRPDNAAPFREQAVSTFKEYFPPYTWIDQEFEMSYTIDKLEASLVYNVNDNPPINLKWVSNLKSLSLQTVFIPAGRLFFAGFVQNNIFSLLANKIPLDPFIEKFGSYYEQARTEYVKYESQLLLASQKDEVREKIKTLAESVIGGKYKYENGQDWIEQKSGKIRLSDASSGQQEALHLLLILSTLPFFYNDKSSYFFIEEPEAHLFPVSQKHIMSLIGILYNKTPHSFVITTHSPYTLTSVNNMIMAYEVSQSKGKEKVGKIIDLDCLINYEDVSAYTINENGVLESIMDDETNLIGANMIDSAFDEFGDSFESLIDVQLSK
ncbi:hypothetical protein MCHI_000946 [Candidatus Magnetoovum chiemensis]|nr:hypothetical protein MCHI_000946 [Candidatus Magnetoovum chiemensis]